MMMSNLRSLLLYILLSRMNGDRNKNLIIIMTITPPKKIVFSLHVLLHVCTLIGFHCCSSAFAFQLLAPPSPATTQQHPITTLLATNTRHSFSSQQQSSLLHVQVWTLHARPGDDNDDGMSDAASHRRDGDDARVDVRNLLTQRSIQTFAFLCEQCRDPHSVKWIEDFLGTKNTLEFHGTGAAYLERFGGSWDGPLLAMMQAPKDVVTVSAKRRGRGHGGWSKDNPFLEDRYVEFEIDIDPVSLVARILSVREQIAKEWVNDLDVLAEANDKILDSYFARVKQEREDKTDREPIRAFERTAVNILTNHIEFTSSNSSPFRKGNFDLLYNLCTQASIHRLLWRFLDAGEAKEVSFEWLKKFYSQRVVEFFDGDQPYGRADQFIEELLLTPPAVLFSDDGVSGGLADPMGIAESIIETRMEIVTEWKQLMLNAQHDHSEIRKGLLTKQMEAWGSSESALEGFQ